MKQPDPRTFLFDVQRACELITEFTIGMTLPEYAADLKTRSAVERQLEIIGEAISQMLKLFPEMQEELPQAAQIIAFRNRLIHGYASVSNQVVWGILEGHLPELATKVKELLAKQQPGGEC
ncbi:MAG TPA: HepT-like ribonuclease domain-containing protein [Thermoanaerobaculia bacterium]|nr:HepT-like ribonuclease domain-containing protein [Thermoanaerobaculia bacterium]